MNYSLLPCASFDYSSKRIESRNYYYCKSFSDSFWVERLYMNLIMSLEDARNKIERWRRDYYEFRPHSAILYLTPTEFARKSGLEAV